MLDFLSFSPYFLKDMQATLTSKGQITIPIGIRTLLHLKTGDVLEFDENAPFLKATKAIPPEAWEGLNEGWKDPFPDKEVHAVLDELRGKVHLPPVSLAK